MLKLGFQILFGCLVVLTMLMIAYGIVSAALGGVLWATARLTGYEPSYWRCFNWGLLGTGVWTLVAILRK